MSPVTRRDFLKKSMATVGALAFGGAIAKAVTKKPENEFTKEHLKCRAVIENHTKHMLDSYIGEPLTAERIEVIRQNLRQMVDALLKQIEPTGKITSFKFNKKTLQYDVIVAYNRII